MFAFIFSAYINIGSSTLTWAYISSVWTVCLGQQLHGCGVFFRGSLLLLLFFILGFVCLFVVVSLREDCV